MTDESFNSDELLETPVHETGDIDDVSEIQDTESSIPSDPDIASDSSQRETSPLGNNPIDELADADHPTSGIGGKKTGMLLIVAIILISFLSVMAWDRNTQGLTLSAYGNLTADQHFDAALEALHERHVPDVISHRNALMQFPGQDDRIAVLNAFTALSIDEKVQTAEFLKELKDTDDPEITTYLYYIAGELAFKQKQYSDALAALNTSVQMSDKVGRKLLPAYQLMASIHYDLGNMQYAMDAATIVSDIDPNNARIFRFMGIVQQDYEQWQDSLNAYQRYTELSPYGDHRESVLTSMAEVHIKLRQFAQALSYIQQVRTSPRLQALAANCEYNLGNVSDALQLLDQSLERDPSQHEAILLKGTIQVQDRHYQEAVDLFVSGLRYYPYDDQFMYKISEAYRGLNDTINAQHYATQSENLRTKRERFSQLNTDVIDQPDNMPIRFELAQLAKAIGKPEIAITWYQAIITIDQTNEQALIEMNRLILQMTRENTGTGPFAPAQPAENTNP